MHVIVEQDRPQRVALERALRTLKRKLERNNVLADLARHRHATTASEARRIKQRFARRRRLRALARRGRNRR